MTQEVGIERRILLGGMFGPKREEVRGVCCKGNIWTQEGGSERSMVLRGIFGPKKEEVRVGYCWGECLDPRGKK